MHRDARDLSETVTNSYTNETVGHNGHLLVILHTLSTEEVLYWSILYTVGTSAQNTMHKSVDTRGLPRLPKAARRCNEKPRPPFLGNPNSVTN